jgi:hypothetical protein
MVTIFGVGKKIIPADFKKMTGGDGNFRPNNFSRGQINVE